MKLEFKAGLWKVTRDHEDETKLTLSCDREQMDIINLIPSEMLLHVTVSVEDQPS